jgi:hypothetical protein
MNDYAMGAMPPQQHKWMLGRSVEEIRAITLTSEESGKSIDEVISSGSWKHKFNELEIEYNNTINRIKLKISESALLLKEAQDLAASINQEGLYNLFDEENENDIIQPIFNELENIGWATSSLSC